MIGRPQGKIVARATFASGAARQWSSEVPSGLPAPLAGMELKTVNQPPYQQASVQERSPPACWLRSRMRVFCLAM